MWMEREPVLKIFSIETEASFLEMAQHQYAYQFAENKVYQQWCKLLAKPATSIASLTDIPFLPISFFKSHEVTTSLFQPEAVFESSGTTATINSKHLVKDVQLYKHSFTKTFERFYGSISKWCIIGLLPSYLERKGSSLTMMVHDLIELSNHPNSGFYLYEHDKLAATLQQLEAASQPTLLIGVTFALLDFAEQHHINLHYTTVMETGGMKGRREELTRSEVHTILKQQLGVSHVHSEYGMTELLSQAYSLGNGLFKCPPWMKVLVRNEEDPLDVRLSGKGVLNVIDLANIYSSSFIATDDIGIVYEDGSFEVQGRLDNSDIRGCSLMVV
jgi:hypothetical protein